MCRFVFVFLFFSSGLFSQSVIFSSLENISVCDPSTISIKIVNDSSVKNSLSAKVQLPCGVEYVSGTITGATESGTDLNSPNFIISELGVDESIDLVFQIIAVCNAISCIDNGDFFQNRLILEHNGSKKEFNSPLYNVNTAQLTISSIDKRYELALGGTIIDREITIKNTRPGRVKDIYIQDEINPNFIKNYYTLLNGKALLKVFNNEIKEIGNMDEYLDYNEEVSIVQRINIPICHQEKYIASEYTTLWKCQESYCESSNGYALIEVEPIPHDTDELKLILYEEDATCSDIDYRTKQYFNVINSADQSLPELKIYINQVSPGYIIDTSSFSIDDAIEFSYEINDNLNSAIITLFNYPANDRTNFRWECKYQGEACIAYNNSIKYRYAYAKECAGFYNSEVFLNKDSKTILPISFGIKNYPNSNYSGSFGDTFYLETKIENIELPSNTLLGLTFEIPCQINILEGYAINGVEPIDLQIYKNSEFTKISLKYSFEETIENVELLLLSVVACDSDCVPDTFKKNISSCENICYANKIEVEFNVLASFVPEASCTKALESCQSFSTQIKCDLPTKEFFPYGYLDYEFDIYRTTFGSADYNGDFIPDDDIIEVNPEDANTHIFTWQDSIVVSMKGVVKKDSLHVPLKHARMYMDFKNTTCYEFNRSLEPILGSKVFYEDGLTLASSKFRLNDKVVEELPLSFDYELNSLFVDVSIPNLASKSTNFTLNDEYENGDTVCIEIKYYVDKQKNIKVSNPNFKHIHMSFGIEPNFYLSDEPIESPNSEFSCDCESVGIEFHGQNYFSLSSKRITDIPNYRCFTDYLRDFRLKGSSFFEKTYINRSYPNELRMLYYPDTIIFKEDPLFPSVKTKIIRRGFKDKRDTVEIDFIDTLILSNYFPEYNPFQFDFTFENSSYPNVLCDVEPNYNNYYYRINSGIIVNYNSSEDHIQPKKHTNMIQQSDPIPLGLHSLKGKKIFNLTDREFISTYLIDDYNMRPIFNFVFEKIPKDIISDVKYESYSDFIENDKYLFLDSLNNLRDSTIVIRGIVDRCDDFSIPLNYGVTCDDISNPYEKPCRIKEDKINIHIEKGKLDIVNTSPLQTIDLCTEQDQQITIINADKGNILDISLKAVLPPGFSIVDGTTECYNPVSQNWIEIRDPVEILESTFFWELVPENSSELIKLKGIDSLNLNYLDFKYTYTTECGAVSGTKVLYSVLGDQFCGESANYLSKVSGKIFIEGDPKEPTSSISIDSFFISACTDTGFISLLLNEKQQMEDSIFMVLPQYVSPINVISDIYNGVHRLPVHGNLMGDTLVVPLQIDNSNSESGSDIITIYSTKENLSICLSTGENCPIQAVNNTVEIPFQLNKSVIYIKDVSLVGLNDLTGVYTVQVNFDKKDNIPVPYPTLEVVQLSGNKFVSEDSIWIKEGQYIVQLEVGSLQDLCSLEVLLSSDNNCVCNTASGYIESDLYLSNDKEISTCTEASIDLSIPDFGNSYSWESDLDLSCYNCATTTVNIPVTGKDRDYQASVLEFDGNSCFIEHDFTIQAKGVPGILNQPSRICSGDTVKLLGNYGDTIYWEGPNIIEANGVLLIATPEVTSEYIYTNKSDDGCVQKDTVRIIVAPPLEMIDLSDNSTCIGKFSEIELTNNPGVTTTYYSNTLQIEESSKNKLLLNGKVGDHQILIIQDNGTCVRQDILNFSWYQNLNIENSYDTITGCIGNEALINIATENDIVWLPYREQMCQNSNCSSINWLIYEGSQELKGIVYDADGCTDTLKIQIEGEDMYNEFKSDTIICSNEVLNWRAQSIFEEGIYFDTLILQSQCNEIYQLEVSLVNISESNYEKFSCFGSEIQIADEVIESNFEGDIVSRNAAGCDSIIHARILFLPPSIDSSSVVLCQEETVMWNDELISAAGIYRDTLSEDSCQYVEVLQAIFSDSINVEYFISPEHNNGKGSIKLQLYNCEGCSFNWGNGSVSSEITDLTAGEYSVDITDQIWLCD